MLHITVCNKRNNKIQKSNNSKKKKHIKDAHTSNQRWIVCTREVRSCRFMATLLWSGNFPRGNQRESRNHLCVQFSLLQRNYPVQTPTSLRAQVPWPSPHTTCKAFQFAAHFVLDIKVERAQASENDMSHDVLGKNKLSQAKESPHPQNPIPPCTSLVRGHPWV